MTRAQREKSRKEQKSNRKKKPQPKNEDSKLEEGWEELWYDIAQIEVPEGVFPGVYMGHLDRFHNFTLYAIDCETMKPIQCCHFGMLYIHFHSNIPGVDLYGEEYDLGTTVCTLMTLYRPQQSGNPAIRDSLALLFYELGRALKGMTKKQREKLPFPSRDRKNNY